MDNNQAFVATGLVPSLVSCFFSSSTGCGVKIKSAVAVRVKMGRKNRIRGQNFFWAYLHTKNLEHRIMGVSVTAKCL